MTLLFWIDLIMLFGHHMKNIILDLSDDQERFVIDGKKDDVVGVITTYIS